MVDGIEDDQGFVPGLESSARSVLAQLELEEAELSVVLCSDEVIRRLNQQWRNHDEPTDVLSFPQDGGEGSPAFAFGPPVLGDVVISLDTARRQAAELGHDVTTELAVLLVHGVLHLQGHDHHEAEARSRMQHVEKELLRSLGHDGEGLVGRAGAD